MAASLPLDAFPAIPKTDVVEQKLTSSRRLRKASLSMTLDHYSAEEVWKIEPRLGTCDLFLTAFHGSGTGRFVKEPRKADFPFRIPDWVILVATRLRNGYSEVLRGTDLPACRMKCRRGFWKIDAVIDCACICECLAPPQPVGVSALGPEIGWSRSGTAKAARFIQSLMMGGAQRCKAENYSREDNLKVVASGGRICRRVTSCTGREGVSFRDSTVPVEPSGTARASLEGLKPPRAPPSQSPTSPRDGSWSASHRLDVHTHNHYCCCISCTYASGRARWRD